MEGFKLDWPVIKLKRRIEIHINSFSFNVKERITLKETHLLSSVLLLLLLLSCFVPPLVGIFLYQEMKRLTMEKQLQRENIQITRVFNIRDPMVSIIYVCPFSLSPDITNYYYKVTPPYSLASLFSLSFLILLSHSLSP
jgi:hypothetical protein